MSFPEKVSRQMLHVSWGWACDGIREKGYFAIVPNNKRMDRRFGCCCCCCCIFFFSFRLTIADWLARKVEERSVATCCFEDSALLRPKLRFYLTRIKWLNVWRSRVCSVSLKTSRRKWIKSKFVGFSKNQASAILDVLTESMHESLNTQTLVVRRQFAMHVVATNLYCIS